MNHEPNQCIILAIDPGRDAGWSIWVRGKLATWGDAEPGNEIGIVRAAQVFAAEEDLPLVVVAEKWTAGGWRSAASMMGLGAAWGRWEGALRAAEHPMRRVVRVYPQTWRARVLRGGRGVTSAQWKHLSVSLANYLAASDDVVLDHNVADAICIGRWAIHAFDVEQVIPKRRAKPR